MSDVTRLARPEILALKAYESARSLVSLHSSYSSGSSGTLDSSASTAGAAKTVYLDANESAFAGQARLNRYPEPQPRELVDRFCELYGVQSKQLVIGRGSDEAIDLLVRAFCRPGQDSVLICPPTYGVYEIAAQIQGAQVVRVPLRFERSGPGLDEAGISRALASGSVKIVFLCSPNNPTGTAFDPATLARICEAADGKALVVVDEAYAEFSDELSMIGALLRFPHLVVLRTLSKAWALAAARCGVAIATPELIQLLQKVRAPYPLPSPAVDAVLAATGNEARAELATRVSALKQARQAFAAKLIGLPGVVEVLPSSANFVLVRFKASGAAAAVMAASRAGGIILRDRSREPGLDNCVRITLGAPSEMGRLLEVLKEVLS